MCIGNTIDDFLYALLPLSLSLVRDLKKGAPNPLGQKLRELHTFSALYFKPPCLIYFSHWLENC